MTVDLAAVKTFLNVTTTSQDGELQLMLDRAKAILGARVGPLTPVTVTDEVHTGPGPLVLHQYPVITVFSATDGGTTVTDVDLDTDTGLVYGSFYSSLRRGARVTYSAGWASLPPDLEAALLELVRHLWSSQRGGGSTRPQFPGESDASSTPSGSGSSYLLPYRVESLIEPHLLPPGIA